MGSALELLNIGKCSLVSHDLKTATGDLHYPFKGSKQQDSHKFLLLMLDWLQMDLIKEVTPVHLMEELIYGKSSTIQSLFQNENKRNNF